MRTEMVRRGALVQCSLSGQGLQSFIENLILMRLIVVSVHGRCPTQALTASRAGGFLRLPINLELTGIKALLLFGLPLVIGSGRGDQIDPVLLTALHKLFGFSIIGVGQVLGGQQLLFLQGLMDHGGDIHISIASPTGLHMRN
jgi:hypothetical protein